MLFLLSFSLSYKDYVYLANGFAQCTLCVKTNLLDCGKPQNHSTAIVQNPFVT